MMNELIKIRDVSDRYSITARTLRYYENAGLITSVRNEEYAYRMYDKVGDGRFRGRLIRHGYLPRPGRRGS